MTDGQNLQNTDNRNDTENMLPLILKTALKTAVAAFVCLVLAVSLIVTFFPYDAMKVYLDLGMKARALECAENYVAPRRDKYKDSAPGLDSRYVSALYTACELSMYLFDCAPFGSDDRAARADEVLKYTEEYLSVAGIYARNDEISRYNVSHEPYHYYHASLFSYRDTLARHNYLARCVKGGDMRNYLLADGYDTLVVSADRIASTLRDLNFTLKNPNGTVKISEMNRFAEIFDMLSAMILYDFNVLGVQDPDSLAEAELGAVKLVGSNAWFSPLFSRTETGNKTELLKQFKERFEEFKQAALDMPESDRWEMLNKLYVFRALTQFADRTFRAVTVLRGSGLYLQLSSDDRDFWFDQTVKGSDGKNYGLKDYYNVLERDYVKMLAASKPAA